MNNSIINRKEVPKKNPDENGLKESVVDLWL